MRGFEGKVALVTGTTKPIGAEIMRRLAAEGVSVVGIGRNTEQGRRSAEQGTATGSRCIFHQADVSSEDDVRSAVARVIDEFGRLDILVNNASGAAEVIGSGQEHPVADEDLETFVRMLTVALIGPFLLAKHSIPRMIEAGGGSIINISSLSGTRGPASQPAYASAKGGLEALTRQIGVDYGPLGIRSNAVMVGSIRKPDTPDLYDHPLAGPALQNIRMLPQIGRPDDVASMVAFLASDEARFVTGSVFAVDGGAAGKLPVPNMSALHKERALAGNRSHAEPRTS
jgi:meso-butanediol dehydrogenase / (S,S)-butanediol dehydrogenase / diacetyl reductase